MSTSYTIQSWSSSWHEFTASRSLILLVFTTIMFPGTFLVNVVIISHPVHRKIHTVTNLLPHFRTLLHTTKLRYSKPRVWTLLWLPQQQNFECWTYRHEKVTDILQMRFVSKCLLFPLYKWLGNRIVHLETGRSNKEGKSIIS